MLRSIAILAPFNSTHYGYLKTSNVKSLNLRTASFSSRIPQSLYSVVFHLLPLQNPVPIACSLSYTASHAYAALPLALDTPRFAMLGTFHNLP